MSRKTLRSLIPGDKIGTRLRIAGDDYLCIGFLHYLVRSRSEGGWHCIDLEPVDDDWPDGGCTCTSYRARRDCRHWRKLCAHLGLDS